MHPPLPDATVAPKRRPGLPKGSKNKIKDDSDPSDAPEPRRRRPPGTGHKQTALAARLAVGELEESTEAPVCPVGRPPKHPPAPPVQVRTREEGHRIHVPGVPAPSRARHLAAAVELINTQNMGNISLPAAPEATSNHILPTSSSTLPSNSASPATTSQNIIPELNPSQNLTLPEDEDNSWAFLNDGIGEDDDGDDPDEDGVFDDEDPTTEPVIAMATLFHPSHAVPREHSPKNNDEKFPTHALNEPEPIIIDGQQEWFMDEIIDERRCGVGFQYLVRYVGASPEMDRRLPGRECANLAALDRWLARPKD
ncbi:hypothetical protein B0H13DRAFT_2302648 [Mycena leptocephala]|nr:hypothetical protein B0H13DRAFT_2302648 [Mycena leptocephala]